jgi:hypothetical protein
MMPAYFVETFLHLSASGIAFFLLSYCRKSYCVPGTKKKAIPLRVQNDEWVYHTPQDDFALDAPQNVRLAITRKSEGMRYK